MASRNFAQVAPTAATIALNAYIYGYGGHSLVTPHAALKQLWWTDERIDAKVTRAFVVSRLRGEEREFLDRPLAFGEGLTDDTYMEWILERAKRLFLILTQVGVPDQIFGCIDDSWDDDDLPIALEDVRALELSSENDEALNKKFYDMQFVYLLRELKKGAHVEYGPKEHIPMEHVNTVPPAVALQPYDRVHFPGRPDDVFMRRKYPLTDRETGHSHRDAFMRDVRKAKALTHEHIASAWGSYTAEDAGFLVSDFVAEHTLATFIEHRTPMQFTRLPPARRPILLVEWMHCLSDALASLHHRGVAHTQIRPSNIWIDRANHIAFADVGSLSTLQKGKKVPKTEAYDYAAPEQQISKSPITLKHSPPPVSSMNAFSKLRKMSTHSVSDASSSSSGGSSTRSNSFSIISAASPVTPLSTAGRSNSMTTIKTNVSPSATASIASGPRSPGIPNFSRLAPNTCPSPPTPTGPLSPSVVSIASSKGGAPSFFAPSIIDPSSLRDLPSTTPEMADVYSLACVFLDILTFMIRGKITDFIKARSTRVSASGTASRVSGKPRIDTSFHYEPSQIESWTHELEADSDRHGASVFRAVPAIMQLIRRMMAQNAQYRPTALEVRDGLQDILLEQGGVEELCCEHREWAEFKEARDERDVKSPFRRDRDELSIATGLLGMPESPKATGSRPTTSNRSTATTTTRTTRRSGDRSSSSMGARSPLSISGTTAAADHVSVLSVVESSFSVDTTKKKRTKKKEGRRRRSSASTATATNGNRFSGWKSRMLGRS